MSFIDRNVTCLNEIYYNEKNNKIIYQKKSGRNFHKNFSNINRQIFLYDSDRNLNKYKTRTDSEKNVHDNNENYNFNEKIIKFQQPNQNELSNSKLNNAIFKKPSITNGQSCYMSSREKKHNNTGIKNIKISFNRFLSNRIMNNYRINPVRFLGICKNKYLNNSEEKKFATDSRNSPYKHKLINSSQLVI